jgi:hypothetical protein
MPWGPGRRWNTTMRRRGFTRLPLRHRAARKPPLTMLPAIADEKKPRECLNRAKVMLNRDFR